MKHDGASLTRDIMTLQMELQQIMKGAYLINNFSHFNCLLCSFNEVLQASLHKNPLEINWCVA